MMMQPRLEEDEDEDEDKDEVGSSPLAWASWPPRAFQGKVAARCSEWEQHGARRAAVGA